MNKILEVYLLETFMLNNKHFMSDIDRYLGHDFSNANVIKYIEQNFDSLNINSIELDMSHDIKNDRFIFYNRNELYNYYKLRIDQNIVYNKPDFFSHSTIFTNDLQLLKKLLRNNFTKLDILEKELGSIESALELIHNVINMKLTSLYVTTINKNDTVNTVSSMRFIIYDINNNYHNIGVLENLIKCRIILSSAIETNGQEALEVFCPYGIYTFKYIIFKLVNKFQLHGHLGSSFEDFFDLFLDKTNSKNYKNVNANNLITKCSEELDFIAISENYYFIFECKSSFIDPIGLSDATFEKKYTKKLKKILYKKDQQLSAIIKDIKKNNTRLYCNSELIDEKLNNKKPVVVFITNQNWWFDLNEQQFKSNCIVLDYNFFDSIMLRLDYNLDFFGRFYDYYIDVIEANTIKYVQSHINQIFMDFINPNFQTMLLNHDVKMQNNALVITDNTFLEFTFKLVDLLHYMDFYPFFSSFYVILSGSVFPYVLYQNDKNLSKKFFDLSLKEKYELNYSKESLKNPKFKDYNSVKFKVEFENNKKFIEVCYLIKLLRTYIV